VIAFLESLSRLPGVEFVLLISHDGVPIAHARGCSESAYEESLAALTSQWLNDLRHHVAPLGWHAPERAFLRGARGTLVLRGSESACLVVVLGREAAPEDVRLSMDSVLARIERARHGRSQVALGSLVGSAEPLPAIPSGRDGAATEESLQPDPHRGHSPSN
jgi:predicted regulator of Ras-like GTPase activity (Roadblock/LC7/MglB family)